MDAAFKEIYATFGVFGVLMAFLGIMIYRGAMAFIRRRNVESVAIEITAQLARDSTTALNVRNEAYTALQDEKGRIERELSKCYETMTAADHEYKDVLLERDRLRADLRISNEQLNDAREAFLAQVFDLNALREENERLKKDKE